VRPYLACLLLFPIVPLFCSVEPARTQAAETQPFNVRHLVALERASEPSISPDGRHVAFTLRTTDLEANKGRKDLWLLDTASGAVRRLTTHPASDSQPQWLSSRSVAFLSNRDGKTQVHAIDIDGGEARALTELALEPDNLRVSADGRLLAFSLEVFPDCPDLACTAKRDKDLAASKATGKVYDSLFARRWDTWSNGKRNHLFVMPVAGGAPVDLTKGLDADCPTRPFGGVEDYALSPDGTWAALSAKAPMGSREAWSTNEDIWLVPTDGSTPPRNLTEDNPARDSQPVFSPDGKSIAYLAMKRPGYEADRNRVVILGLADGAKRWITEEWDRSPDAIRWASGGDKLLVTAYDLGQHAIFSVDARTGKPRRVAAEGHADLPVEAPGGLVFLRDSIVSPADFWTVSLAGGREKRLTRLNAERLERVRLGTAEQFSFAGARGDTVHAYLVKPVDFDPAKKYPLAYLVHGGPQGSMANDWHYRWNPQTYAGAGYAAVLVDFHGSSGYGQAFQDAINGDWGGAPFEDLMKGLDATLHKYPWIDGARACALGASFGGYMVNYIAGKTDRFKCLVTHDGNLDERMAYFDTEELWFPEWEHGGTPWDNPEGYAKHNPIELVKNWKTPTLVVHGALDYRVVDTQGLSVFTALQRKGIPSRLLYFPDENHWVLKPANSILWHDTVLGWLDRWVKKG
jgi:dipeptidyl aminopeptidase/acylaminoacyl peptidase